MTSSIRASVVIVALLVSSAALAASDRQNVRTLGRLVAMQERCKLNVSEIAIGKFVAKFPDPAQTFARFSLSKDVGDTEVASASDLEMVVKCAVLREFAAENDLIEQ